MTAGQEITQPGEFGKRSETSSKLTALARGVLVEIAGYHMINLQYSQRIGSPTGLAAVLNQTLDDTELSFQCMIHPCRIFAPKGPTECNTPSHSSTLDIHEKNLPHSKLQTPAIPSEVFFTGATLPLKIPPPR